MCAEVPADGADGVNLGRLLWLALVALRLPFLDDGNLQTRPTPHDRVSTRRIRRSLPA